MVRNLLGASRRAQNQCPSRDSNQQRLELGSFIAEGLLFSYLLAVRRRTLTVPAVTALRFSF